MAESRLGSHKIKALRIEDLPIDKDWAGVRWNAEDLGHLSKLIALVAMGHAAWAAHIITTLGAFAALPTHASLVREAKVRLSVGTKTGGVRSGYPRDHRDGFIFEIISWVASRESYGTSALLRAPHLSATSQGLDGLMLELSAERDRLERVTVFEDKCTEDPRSTFLKAVIPTFVARHTNARAAELVATAADLLERANLNAEAVTKLAQEVMDLRLRRYQAAFAVPESMDSDVERSKLFKDYERVSGVDRHQRVGATFTAGSDVRAWFETLARLAIDYLDSL